MDGRAVCKVMLYSYIQLEHRCELTDRAIYNMAIRSAYKNTFEVCADIEKQIEEKISYINTKVIIDKGIAKLNGKYELVQHHINGVSIDELMEKLGKSRTSIDNKLRYQRNKLYDAILNHYTAEELLSVICGSSWLMNRYKKALKEALNGDNIKDKGNTQQKQ
jgi:hypothetical protein